MRVSDFDYALPPELIAQHPAAQRSASRLLHLDARTGEVRDRMFAELPTLVGPGDTLVVNDTRVIKARLAGRKASGGKVEVFLERALGTHEALVLIRASRTVKAGTRILVGRESPITVEGREGELYRVRFEEPVEVILERDGAVPLPPYITHAPAKDDAERYQTVFAKQPGAVAAPTAGLHFDDAVVKQIEARGARMARVTLHVGAGTFQPVRTENVEDHHMHRERYSIPDETVQAMEGHKVLAVGTTSLRALESWKATGERQGDTGLFIYPGYTFRAVDRLLTNFHLPKSSLMMLVAAFAGLDAIRKAYAHAIEQRYRFFSYGDAMLIER